MAENQSLASDSDDENTRNRRSRLRSGNNDKRSICWRYFEPFKVPRDGTTIKCAIDGCNTSYVWRGSTSNLLGHLKTNHSITKSSEHTTYIRSSSNINSVNSELEINLSLIKFIVSAGAPFSIIEYLKSAEFVNPQYKLPPSNIVEEQINRAYDRLFFQLKLKAQQTKSVTLSFHLIPGGSIHHIKMFMGVTCHFLSENFESYRFLLCISRVTKLCGDENCGRIWRNECFEALNKWGLINQKFISIGSSTIGILKGLSEKLCQNYIQNFIPLIYEEKDEVQYDINKLIQMCLQGWTEKNNGSQGMLKVIKVIDNSIKNLCSIVNSLKSRQIQNAIQTMQNYFSFQIINEIKNARQIKCDCTYHKILFFKLMEYPFKQLLRNHNNYSDVFVG